MQANKTSLQSDIGHNWIWSLIVSRNSFSNKKVIMENHIDYKIKIMGEEYIIRHWESGEMITVPEANFGDASIWGSINSAIACQASNHAVQFLGVD